MKKKTLIYALLASAFITVVASCDDANTTNNNTNTPSVSISSDYETPEIHNYRIEDNELSKKVYAAISKSFNISNVTYEEFLTNTSKTNIDSKIKFDFNNSMYAVTVELDLGELFLNAEIGNNNTWIEYQYKDGEWFKNYERIFINNEDHQINYNIVDGIIIKNEKIDDPDGNWSIEVFSKYINNEWVDEEKYESTLENGKQVSCKVSKYINNEWVIVEDSTVYSSGSKYTYKLTLNEDGTFKEKFEATYDDNGNTLSTLHSSWINNEWVDEEKYEYTYDSNGKILTSSRINFNTNYREEDTYDSNGNKAIYSQYRYINNEWVKIEECVYVSDSATKPTMIITLNEDGSFNTKEERIYDDNVEWNYKEYKYINNEWVKTGEGFVIRGNDCLLSYSKYSLVLNEDGTFAKKVERTYDDNLNNLSTITSKYINNEWVYEEKEENTYNANGKELSHTSSKYINNEWVYIYKNEFTFDENGNTTTVIYSEYINNEWVYDFKFEYTYDSNGDILTETHSKYEDNTWKYDWKDEYIRRDNQFIRVHYYSNGTDFNSFKEENIYVDGNCIAKIEYEYSNNEWVYERKEENTYNENGKLELKVLSKYINNEWVKWAEWLYVNDSSIEPAIRITFNEDGSFNTKEERTFDEFGNIASEKAYIYQNGEWVEKQ